MSGFFSIRSPIIPRFLQALLAILWRSAVLRQIALFGRSLKLVWSKGIMISAMYVPSLCSLQDVLVINARLLHISLLIKESVVNTVMFHQFSNKQATYIMPRIRSVIFTKSVSLSFHFLLWSMFFIDLAFFVLLKTSTKLIHLVTIESGKGVGHISYFLEVPWRCFFAYFLSFSRCLNYHLKPCLLQGLVIWDLKMLYPLNFI